MIEKFSIIVDTREQKPLVFPQDDCYSDIIMSKLDTGDYSIAQCINLIALDRKASVSELAKNITEDRFKDCLERMAAAKYKFLVCEFNYSDVEQFPVGANIPPKIWAKLRIGSSFILSFLAQIQIKYGISVLFCDSPTGAATMVLKLFKRIWIEENK